MVGFGRARVQRLDERGDALRAVRTAERAGDDGSDVRAAHVKADRDPACGDDKIFRRRRIGRHGVRAVRRRKEYGLIQNAGNVVDGGSIKPAPDQLRVQDAAPGGEIQLCGRAVLRIIQRGPRGEIPHLQREIQAGKRADGAELPGRIGVCALAQSQRIARHDDAAVPDIRISYRNRHGNYLKKNYIFRRQPPAAICNELNDQILLSLYHTRKSTGSVRVALFRKQ